MCPAPKHLDYATGNGRIWRFRLRRAILIALMTSVVWPVVAVGRLEWAHRRLMWRIDHGWVSSNGNPKLLNRNLLYWRSLRPLLYRPWRLSFSLHYANGYGNDRFIKIE